MAKPIAPSRRRRLAALIPLAFLGVAAVANGAADAATGGRPRPGTSGSTFSGPVMVVDLNGNGAPNYGDTVTFNVATTATAHPQVKFSCYQDGTMVAQGYLDFFGGLNGPNLPLRNGTWWSDSQAADCTAQLMYFDKRGREVMLGRIDFVVQP
jgi:hypothetical protein